jgi:hypothetical protein
LDVGISVLAFTVLARAPIDLAGLRRLPIYLLAGTAVTLLGTVCIDIFPASVSVLGTLYSGFVPREDMMQTADVTSRKQGLSLGSNTALRVLCSYFVPITLVNPIHFWRFSATMLCLMGVLLSGFRSSLLTVLMYGIVSSFFRRRVHDIIVLAIIGVFAVGVLALGNGRIFTLPLSVQRALTVFPGNWDYVAKADAEGSTQWRLEMWKIVLLEDRYIKDRLLGDGYGFTRFELGMMQSEMSGRTGFIGAARQEGFMISGMFHSGPLSTIRYVGYVGLFIYTALIIHLSVRAWHLIRRSEGTDYFAPALFVGMPLIILPIIFYFLAGQFQYNLPDTIFLAGLLKLMERGVAAREEQGADSAVSGQSPSARQSTPRRLVPSYLRP